MVTAALFPQLDKTEVDTFRSLHRADSIPHGTSNCWQLTRLARAPGDRAWLESSWPEFKHMLNHVLALRNDDGVPVGGSSYDTFRFPGPFSYTTGLYLTALEAIASAARYPVFLPATWASVDVDEAAIVFIVRRAIGPAPAIR